MRISDNIKLKDIQAAFSQKFPYLKIEFYKSFDFGFCLGARALAVVLLS